MDNEVFEVIKMPEWKNKILNAVAFLLGLKNEKVYLITISDSDE